LPASRNTPFHLECRWRTFRRVPEAAVPNELRSWLLDTGSLTERLITVSDNRFRVEVLGQRRAVPRRSELRALGLKPRSVATIREVLLYGRDIPWVYARTVIPLPSLTGPLAALRKLDQRPLGAMLFAHHSLHRGQLEIASFPGRHPSLPLRFRTPDATLWGRRSVFRVTGKALLVSEIFLPTFNPGTNIHE
jgi:chorismate--pyruvate lyase